MSFSLSAHSPKFNSQLVGREALAALPAPEALGRFHKPIPHAVLVDAFTNQAALSGYDIIREQFALGKAGAALFAGFDLKPADEGLIRADRAMSFGLRNATDSSMAIRGVAGERVFICDNMNLSGTMFAIQRKNSIQLDLGDAMRIGFERFTVSIAQYRLQVERMENATIVDARAKEIIFDVFRAGILPARLLDDVADAYFDATADMTDCTPRTLAGLHNAMTRAARDLSPRGEFSGSIALGAAFAKLVE